MSELTTAAEEAERAGVMRLAEVKGSVNKAQESADAGLEQIEAIQVTLEAKADNGTLHALSAQLHDLEAAHGRTQDECVAMRAEAKAAQDALPSTISQETSPLKDATHLLAAQLAGECV